MRGRLPKSPELRQRRNKESTRAKLPSEADAAASGIEVPQLPKISDTEMWHPMVQQWWTTVWRSPMACEYLDTDKEGLYLLARLHQDFYTAPNAIGRQALAAEIRQQGVRFGLSPIDRRRLQWEIEKGDQADERTQRRKATKPSSSRKDPRESLKPDLKVVG